MRDAWRLILCCTGLVCRLSVGFQHQPTFHRHRTFPQNSPMGKHPFYASFPLRSASVDGSAAEADPSLKLASGIQELTNLRNLASSNIKIRPTAYDLLQSAAIGIATGYSVAAFKLSIQLVQTLCYGQPFLIKRPSLAALCPAVGGLVVGLLTWLGPFRAGFVGTVEEVDQSSSLSNAGYSYSNKMQNHFEYLQKALASVITLGTGCSLGPEGPCCEIGMGVARSCMDVNRKQQASETAQKDWNRLLLSCGAASGVAAGFNAPIAGVFFAMEVMQDFFTSVDNTNMENDNSNGNVREKISFTPKDVLCSSTGTAKLAPILLSSVLAALCARTILGSHLALAVTCKYSLKNPLLEMPLYVGLGMACAGVSVAFDWMTQKFRLLYAGQLGQPSLRRFLKRCPLPLKPLSAGLICGLVSLQFPQIRFFGYDILNPLLGNTALPTVQLLTLLLVKMSMTAMCASSGLVGGTFAPSLFLGAVTGASLHNLATGVLGACSALTGAAGSASLIADVPAYAIIGAGSVLAGVFRAPLTACLMIFEVTRDYDVILPLMVSAGVSGLLVDIFQGKAGRWRQRRDS